MFFCWLPLLTVKSQWVDRQKCQVAGSLNVFNSETRLVVQMRKQLQWGEILMWYNALSLRGLVEMMWEEPGVVMHICNPSLGGCGSRMGNSRPALVYIASFCDRHCLKNLCSLSYLWYLWKASLLDINNNYD
jgi:hypothetical protein